MSAVRVFQSISSVFPWNNGGQSEQDNDSNDRLLKRRKTQTSGGVNASGGRCAFHGAMRLESNLSCTSTASSSEMSDEWWSDDTMADSNNNSNNEHTSRETLMHALADRGIPSHLDPYSIDHCVHFEGSDDFANGRTQAIPTELMTAIHHGEQQQLIQRLQDCGNSNYLKSLRTSDGETLLHLAASTACHAVVGRLLQPDMQLSTMVLDRHGRTPLHSLCLSISRKHHDLAIQHQHLETMRILFRHSPSLVLYMDQDKMTPLEYLHNSNHNEVNDLLVQEHVVERVAQEMSRQMHVAHSGQHMSAMERVDCMVNLSGVDAAIMETGFSI